MLNVKPLALHHWKRLLLRAYTQAFVVIALCFSSFIFTFDFRIGDAKLDMNTRSLLIQHVVRICVDIYRP